MQIKTGCAAVDAMAGISITGNIIPQQWYKTVTKPSGKPYLTAIVILSDIVYWYRPAEVRDEGSGHIIGYKKRFSADMLQRSYGQLSEQFGISKKEATSAITHLESIGVIKRHFRTLEIGGVKMNNVLFIELVPSMLAAITFGDTYALSGGEGISPKGDTLSPRWGIGVPPKSDTNTETTTKTNTETTTKKKPQGGSGVFLQ